MMDEEIWKAIPGWEGLYEVSNRGRVRSLDRVIVEKNTSKKVSREGQMLSTQLTKDGYPRLKLSRGSRQQSYKVHRLVLLAFAGPAPKGHEARHLNGDPADNRWPENLAWATHGDNMHDMIAHGTVHVARGEANHNSKLSDKRVEELFMLAGIGWTQKEIARYLGCTQTHVGYILAGKNRVV